MTVQPDIEKFHIYADVATPESAYGSFMSSATFQASVMMHNAMYAKKRKGILS
jgi:hypothetical protein